MSTIKPFVPPPIADDEPLGKNDEHTLFGHVWRHWRHMDAASLWQLRHGFWLDGNGGLGWKIEPIEDEI